MTDATDRDSSGADRPDPPEHASQLPAQKAMKQLSKTEAERGDIAGPNDGPALTQRKRQDKPQGES